MSLSLAISFYWYLFPLLTLFFAISFSFVLSFSYSLFPYFYLRFHISIRPPMALYPYLLLLRSVSFQLSLSVSVYLCLSLSLCQSTSFSLCFSVSVFICETACLPLYPNALSGRRWRLLSVCYFDLLYFPSIYASISTSIRVYPEDKMLSQKQPKFYLLCNFLHAQ